MNAAALETATSDARAKAKAAYATAKAELDALKPPRPIGELEALLAERTVGRNCRHSGVGRRPRRDVLATYGPGRRAGARRGAPSSRRGWT
jgi:hypothetical protein